VTTKQGKKYIDTFGVYIYINKKYNQYKIITDSTTIWLPDTIKTGDIIEIRAIKNRRRINYKKSYVYYKKRTHVIKKTIKYKGEECIEVSAKGKKYFDVHLRTRKIRIGVPIGYW
jgi:hypothetical protein